MPDFTLWPLNDFAKFLKSVKDISPTTGVLSDLTTGTITCFFSTGNLPTSTAADPSLSNTAIHVSGSKWLVFFDAGVLTADLLDTKFAAAPPFLIVQYPSGFRVYFTGEYVASRPGTVT
jgi:hypothetical protein